jgi:hypothetical protein
MSLRAVGSVKDTTVVTLKNPNPRGPQPTNAAGEPATITLHGPYSARYKKTMREQQRKWLSNADGKEGRLNLTPEEVEDATRATVIACIETWSLTIEGDTDEPFSVETANLIFNSFPWVYDQVSAALGDIANFLDVSRDA